MNAVPTAAAARSHRDIRRSDVATLLAGDDAHAAIALHGTPLLLLDPEVVRRQHQRLRAALPDARLHYAVKALSHDDVIAALSDDGCGFDVASAAELALVSHHGVGAERLIHTHPIKKAADIAHAIAAGLRTFVVDNETEIQKFADAPCDVRVLIRLAYRSPHAKSDLSGKFGVGPFEAGRLVAKAKDVGIRVAGFSFHVGSQLDDPQRFADATADTLTLMEHLEHEFCARFDTLDIGGGFPVGYDSPTSSLEDVAAAIRPVLDARARHLTVIAEPGRILVAEAMALVTSVIGVSERSDGRWYYLDDGVYGSYSNVATEDVHPLVFAAHELDAEDAAAHRGATLAGPTCDSADVIARNVLLPHLHVGDLLVSPTMGAYTTVTASRFNGIEPTPVAVVARRAVSAAISTLAASRTAVAA
jgi:ornithine decarboxylase